MTPIKTILFPTDFSPATQTALELAGSLAKDHDARLIVLHVLERPVVVQSGVMTPPPPEPSLGEQREKLREQLDRIQPPRPGVRIERRLEEGDTATAILEVARELRADLIVMGTHGRTGLHRLLMGSVAETVVRKAACPVLTVKSPMPAGRH
jgi:nucleotide-binding universal stress UspA family protein